MRLATSTGRDYERAEAVRNRIHAYIVSRRRCGACPQKSAALGRFSRTYPAQYTQNIIHTVEAAQVLQSGQRFGVGHARLNFRKTVEGMFEFTSKKLSESTVLWSTALTLHPTSRTGSARTPSGRYFSFELLLHRGNGKYRQLPQPPNKCFPIAAPLVVFAPPMPPASRCGVSALQ